jgi:hypothetical protein
MNTADRSVGHLDYAVRRRFAFVYCGADRKVIEGYGHPARDAAVALFAAVQALFSEESVSPEFSLADVQIGHTYFLVSPEGAATAHAELMRKFVYQVYPILREYVKDGILRTPVSGGLRLPGLEGVVLDREMQPTDVQRAVEEWFRSRGYVGR